MRQVVAHNVNQALYEGPRALAHSGIRTDSRNGPVIRLKEPLITHYKEPTRRVLFSPLRDANPFFHLMEALWMLAGRNDIEFLTRFVKNFSQFSDDGLTQHGAYGYRWRQHFKFDQLDLLVEELTKNPHSRRAVLQMWDAPAEWEAMAFGNAKDVPCNTQVYFELVGGALNMMVTCRSNDMWWGGYGANAVHFSILQEYMAARLGAGVGWYEQLSFNAHIYPANLPSTDLDKLAEDASKADRYTASAPPHHARTIEAEHAPTRVPLVQRRFGYDLGKIFDADLAKFFENPLRNMADYTEPFLAGVAAPMYAAWTAHKEKRYADAFELASHIKAGDWNIACTEWLERRAQARADKENFE